MLNLEVQNMQPTHLAPPLSSAALCPVTYSQCLAPDSDVRNVSLTRIDSSVTVLKREIAANVIWLKCQSFAEVTALWMCRRRRARVLNTNSTGTKKKTILPKMWSSKRLSGVKKPESYFILKYVLSKAIFRSYCFFFTSHHINIHPIIPQSVSRKQNF